MPSPLVGEGGARSAPGEGYKKSDLHYGALMSRAFARRLRRDQTDAEKALWSKLRNRQLDDNKFKRQETIGPYVVDFVCHEKKLIVEVDGGQHATETEKDDRRTRWLNSEGYNVIRFWNNDIIDNTDGVVSEIGLALKNLPSF